MFTYSAAMEESEKSWLKFKSAAHADVIRLSRPMVVSIVRLYRRCTRRRVFSLQDNRDCQPKNGKSPIVCLDTGAAQPSMIISNAFQRARAFVFRAMPWENDLQ